MMRISICMYKHARLVIRCSEIVSSPFSNASRAVVVTWYSEYCIHFLASMCACANPADFDSLQDKVSTFFDTHGIFVSSTAVGVASLERQLELSSTIYS